MTDVVQERAEGIATLSVGDRAYQVVVPDAGSDYIQRILARGEIYEQGLLIDMARRVEPGELVLDVGANVGNHSLYLAASGIRVIAFEPDAHLTRAIRRSVALNGFDELLEVRENAVGARSGRGTLLRRDEKNLGAQFVRAGGDELDSDDVAAVGETGILTLDQQAYPGRVAAVKIDVEGMELAVLEGAALLLEQDRPLVYIEVLSAEHFRQAYQRLGPLGYRYQATFNYSPTHLFAPGHEPVDDATIEATVQLASRMYTAEESTRSTQERLNAANAKYRGATELIGSLRSGATLAGGGTNVDAAARADRALELLALSQQREVEHTARIVELREALLAKHAEASMLASVDESARAAVTDLKANQSPGGADQPGDGVRVDRLSEELDQARSRAERVEHERDELATRLRAASARLAARRRHASQARQKLEELAARLDDELQSRDHDRALLARAEQELEQLGAALALSQQAGERLRARLAVAEYEAERDAQRTARAQDDRHVVRRWIAEAQERERQLDRRIALLTTGDGIKPDEIGQYVPTETLHQLRADHAKAEARLERLDEAERQVRMYRARLVEVRGSKTFRLGKAFREGVTSFRGFLRMPLVILRILREPPDDARASTTSAPTEETRV